MPRFRLSTFKVIRMKKQGCTNRPFFQIIVVPKYKPRQAIPNEVLGFYDPVPNLHNEKVLAVNLRKVQYWMGKGAVLTLPLQKLLGLSGFLPVHPTSYLEALRSRESRGKPKPIESEEGSSV